MCYLCLSLDKSSLWSHLTLFFSDLYKLTDEVLGQGAYAKVQECVSLQNGQAFAVKVRISFFRKYRERHVFAHTTNFDLCGVFFFSGKDHRKDCRPQPQQSISRSGDSLPMPRKQVGAFNQNNLLKN